MLIDDSNESCNNISAICLKVGGESMSAVCFWTKEKENLPHLYYFFSNPSHWGHSSRQSSVMSQVPWYSLKYRKEIKERSKESTSTRLERLNCVLRE